MLKYDVSVGVKILHDKKVLHNVCILILLEKCLVFVQVTFFIDVWYFDY